MKSEKRNEYTERTHIAYIANGNEKENILYNRILHTCKQK